MDLSGLDSKLDCNGLISQSDNEADSDQTKARTFAKKILPSTSKDTGLNLGAPNLINQQILQQVTVLSKRLDNIKTASAKKMIAKKIVKKWKKRHVKKQKPSDQTPCFA